MKNQHGQKVTAKNMTKRDAVTYLVRLQNHLSDKERRRGECKGRKYRRALEIAISTIKSRIDVPTGISVARTA
jgi:hypothetical protein